MSISGTPEEVRRKLRQLREEKDPDYLAFLDKMKAESKERERKIRIELREAGEGAFSHGSSRTENWDCHLEPVDCPRCGRRGQLRVHYTRAEGSRHWLGPYFQVIHQPGPMCHFGKFYPDVINTLVPEPDR